MRDSSLDPTPWSRLYDVVRPDWCRTVRARRILAGALVAAAGVAAVWPAADDNGIDVVVATRDLHPGAALTADDVHLEKRSATTVPDGSSGSLAAVSGATLAGPARRGEILTDVRLLGTRLAAATAGPDARIVPLHLTDEGLFDLIRVGDVVDVLAAPDSSQPAPGQGARVVATDAVVVLISAVEKGSTKGSDRVALVALPARVANSVASLVLGRLVTLTLH